MGEITIKPKGKALENKEVKNREITINEKFLYACSPSDLVALRSWAHTQEEMFNVSDIDVNKKVDALIKKIDSIISTRIFGGK